MNMNSSSTNSTYENLIEDAAVIDYLNEFGLITPTLSESNLLPILRSGKDATFAIQDDSPGVRSFQSLLAYEHLNRAGTGTPPLTLIAVGSESKDLILSQLRAMKLPARDCAYISEDEEIAVGSPLEVQNLLEGENGRSRMVKRTIVMDIQPAEVAEARALISGLAKSRKRAQIVALSREDEGLAIEVCRGILAGIGAKINHNFFEVGPELLDKPKALCDFVEGEGLPRTVVFCNLPSDADLIESMLRKRGIAARKLIGNVPQARIKQAMAQSNAREVVALIATDVSARLLEPGDFDLVINYSIPSDADVYTQRTTAGGAGNLKRAINLVGPLDKTNLHYLRKMLDVEIEQIDLPTPDSISAAKLVNLKGFISRSSEVIDDRIKEIAALIIKGDGEVAGDTGISPEQMVAFLLNNFFQYAMPALTNVSEGGSDEDRGRGRRGERRGRGERAEGGRDDRGRDDRGRDERGDRASEERDGERGAKRTSDRRREDRRGDERRGDERRRGEQGEERASSRGRRDEAEGGSYEESSSSEGGRRSGAGRGARGPVKRSERIYVGKGFQDGFGTMAAETAASAGGATAGEGAEAVNIPLERISVREYYSFIDVEEPHGDLFIQRLQPVLGEDAIVRKAVALNHPRQNEDERGEEGRGEDEGRDYEGSGEEFSQEGWSAVAEGGQDAARQLASESDEAGAGEDASGRPAEVV